MGRNKKEGEMAEEQAQPVTFVSRHGKLQITVKHDEDKWNGPHYIGKTPDKIAKFAVGRFTTDDPEIIEALRNHSGYKNGRLFTEVKAAS